MINVLSVEIKIDLALVLVRLTWRTFVEVKESRRDCAIESNGCHTPSSFPSGLQRRSSNVTAEDVG